MTLKLGPNLSLLVDGAIGESHYPQLMSFFRGVDALVMPRVISATLTTPPATPTAGDTYIVPSGATGAWAAYVNCIARYTTGNAQGISQWEFYSPKMGWTVNINDNTLGGSTSGNLAKFSGSAWVVLNVVGAPLDSPAFTGTPTVPTAVAGTNTTQIANTAFVTAAITALLNGAGSALDTLNELATALGNDANFATTMATALGLKAALASPAFSGTPTAPTAAAGTNTTQIANTAFVTAAVAAGLLLPPNTQTGTTYTLALTDLAMAVDMNNAAANTVSIPLNSSVPFPIGTVIPISQIGAGQTSVVAISGVTLLNSHATAKISAQNASVTIRKRATDTWIIEGNLAAS